MTDWIRANLKSSYRRNNEYNYVLMVVVLFVMFFVNISSATGKTVTDAGCLQNLARFGLKQDENVQLLFYEIFGEAGVKIAASS